MPCIRAVVCHNKIEKTAFHPMLVYSLFGIQSNIVLYLLLCNKRLYIWMKESKRVVVQCANWRSTWERKDVNKCSLWKQYWHKTIVLWGIIFWLSNYVDGFFLFRLKYCFFIFTRKKKKKKNDARLLCTHIIKLPFMVFFFVGWI